MDYNEGLGCPLLLVMLLLLVLTSHVSQAALEVFFNFICECVCGVCGCVGVGCVCGCGVCMCVGGVWVWGVYVCGCGCVGVCGCGCVGVLVCGWKEWGKMCVTRWEMRKGGHRGMCGESV